MQLAYLALISSSSLCSKSSFNSSSDASEGFCNRGFGFNKRKLLVFLCVKCGGRGPPSSPKDALCPCGEGNLGRSSKFFLSTVLPPRFTSTHPPVEKPPATSQLFTSVSPRLITTLMPYSFSIWWKCIHAKESPIPTFSYSISHS